MTTLGPISTHDPAVKQSQKPSSHLMKKALTQFQPSQDLRVGITRQEERVK